MKQTLDACVEELAAIKEHGGASQPLICDDDTAIQALAVVEAGLAGLQYISQETNDHKADMLSGLEAVLSRAIDYFRERQKRFESPDSPTGEEA